ncbi:MAG: TrkA family potassium uptake protein [Cyanobacteria bacterium REEB67]|nr:TrkA family potassium uptake protein [Cyanobacteria bacterium REEB67]
MPINYSAVTKKGKRFLLLLRVLFVEFRGFLVCAVLAFTLSTSLFYFLYPQALVSGGKLSLTQAAYYVLLMIFFESPLTYVDDLRLSPLFFLLPILGLVTIAEGVVHLGNLLFQHKRYSKEWQKMIATTMENHVIVCGLGNVGVRVVQHLRQFSEDVVAIETNQEARFVSEVASYEVPVLFGDVRDANILEQASVLKAKAIIAVTDNDLANLEAALTARELNPNIRVVIRMFDQKLAKKVQNFMGIEGAYSSSARSARLFAQAAISGDILDSFEFGGTVINAMQLLIEPNTAMVGAPIDELRNKYEVTVLCQEKNDGTVDWNPAPTNVLEVGDKLLIMTDVEGLKRLEKVGRKLAIPRE